MAARLKLIVAYDGVPFSGWQSQANGKAIQDRIEQAFKLICSRAVRVHGAGRTDAGVHALAQCAHVDVPNQDYSPERWRAALNGILPPTIRIMRCGYVPESFHARFSAKGKVYRYRIWNAAVLPPLENARAWHVVRSLDWQAMMAAATDFQGEHDFAGFAANRGTPPQATIRTIHSVRLRRNGPSISMEFEGNGFLYKMVRMMAGSLVHIGIGKTARPEIKARLKSPRNATSNPRTAAPAEGLYLVRVRY